VVQVVALLLPPVLLVRVRTLHWLSRRRQALAGALAAGAWRSLQYGGAKLAKAWRSR